MCVCVCVYIICIYTELHYLAMSVACKCYNSQTSCDCAWLYTT